MFLGRTSALSVESGLLVRTAIMFEANRVRRHPDSALQTMGSGQGERRIWKERKVHASVSAASRAEA